MTPARKKSARKKPVRKKKPATAAVDPLLAAPDPDASQEALKTLTGIVKRIDAANRKVEKAAEKLDQANDELGKLMERELPEYMSECAISEIRLRDGRLVKCETKTYGTIKVDDRPKAYAWLRKHDHGGIIKNTVTATFKAGEDVAAGKLQALVAKRGYGVEKKEAIHAGTLKSWIREMTESGKKIPAKLFGIYQCNEVTISKARSK